MPCRDDGWPQEERVGPDAQKRLDKLTQELCDARRIIAKLESLFDFSKLSKDERQDIKRHLEGQEEHRKKDKQRALAEAKANLGKLESTMKKIKELGGECSKTMIRQHKDLMGKLEDIKNADPMDTDLF